MRLLKINNFSTLKLLNSTYHSTISIANEQIANENKRIEFIETRQKLWDQLKAEHDESLTGKKSVPIKLTLEYGRAHEGVSWQSTPAVIYRQINRKAYEKAIVARVNNQLWDLNRPLEEDCTVEVLPFENPLGKEVLWHSAAHVLGSALETIYGCLLNTGPATNNGFYYDISNNDKIVSSHVAIFLKYI